MYRIVSMLHTLCHREAPDFRLIIEWQAATVFHKASCDSSEYSRRLPIHDKEATKAPTSACHEGVLPVEPQSTAGRHTDNAHLETT